MSVNFTHHFVNTHHVNDTPLSFWPNVVFVVVDIFSCGSERAIAFENLFVRTCSLDRSLHNVSAALSGILPDAEAQQLTAQPLNLTVNCSKPFGYIQVCYVAMMCCPPSVFRWSAHALCACLICVFPFAVLSAGSTLSDTLQCNSFKPPPAWSRACPLPISSVIRSASGRLACLRSDSRSIWLAHGL